jgi:hypothetical protein
MLDSSRPPTGRDMDRFDKSLVHCTGINFTMQVSDKLVFKSGLLKFIMDAFCRFVGVRVWLSTLCLFVCLCY